MTSRVTFFALCLTALFCLGCGSTVGNNQPASETRTVSPFTLVDVSDGVEVILTVDPSQSGDVSLEVTAESNLLPSVVTTVSNDTLGVGVSDSVQSNLPITVTGTVNDIVSAQARRGSTLAVEEIDGETLNVGAAEGAMVTAEGSVDSLVATAADGATLTCGDLSATSAEVGLDNGATAILCVTGEVTGSVRNGATLTVLCGGDASGVSTSNGGTVN